MTLLPTGALDDESDRPALPTLIHRIEIEDLFSEFSYDLRIPQIEVEGGDALGRLALLYGDNGCGKSTVLQLVWHALSPADRRGHKTAIAQTPFRFLRITLHDEYLIEIYKYSGLIGPFTITVIRHDEEVISASYETDKVGRVRPQGDNYILVEEVEGGVRPIVRDQPEGDIQYSSFLSALEVNPVMLADDRNIYSDRYAENNLPGQEERAKPRLTPEDSRERVAEELHFVLRRTNEYLRQLTLGGQASGSAGANSIYLDVLSNLTRIGREPTDASLDRTLSDRIVELGVRSARFEEFGLVPHFAAKDFIEVLPQLDGERSQIASDILSPYLDSLQARLDALQEAEKLIRTFLEQANGFLKNKRLTFKPREGVRIYGPEGRLTGAALSSGERQLILLLCNTLLARANSRLFIIDEPELSLNVKWQRKILHALLACANGSNVQFLVATHSIEIIARNRPSLLKLEEVPIE